MFYYFEKKLDPMFALTKDEREHLDPALFDYEAANQLDVSSFKFISNAEITRVAQAIPLEDIDQA